MLQTSKEITSVNDLLDTWRVMKVLFNDSHIGPINKIDIINRFEIPMDTISRERNVEVFAFVPRIGRVCTMKQLEDAERKLRNKTMSITFRSFHRETNKETNLRTFTLPANRGLQTWLSN